MALLLDPLSLGFAVDVEPDLCTVQQGDTATFHCEEITDQPIHHFSWQISPPVSLGRYSYDNNQKTIHITNIKTTENNLQVTCTAISQSGTEMSASARVALLQRNNDEDDGGGDGDEDGDGDGDTRTRPIPRRTTPKTRPTPNQKPISTIQPQPTSVPSNEDMFTRPRVSDGRNSTSSMLTRRTPLNVPKGKTSGNYTGLNPATLGTLIVIIGMILIAGIIVIVRRVRKDRKTKSRADFARSHSGVQFNSRGGYHSGYEDAPSPPMAPTIDSRHSQSPDVIPAGHNHRRHNLYSPKYQKPFHKSLPSVYSSPKIVDDVEYEYMEPGADQRGQSLGQPLGDGYDHLARSQPEALNKVGVAATGTTKNYAMLTTASGHQRTCDYENQHMGTNQMFELEEGKLKYASLSHNSDGSVSPSVVQPQPQGKTSYAKIRGVLKILRTRNSTRVNIEPC